ncbi:hypothetical protein FGO68_gene12437 [Halteria grandinella]|uniref:Uncharacterized protein n=1 Tax=Halteria grandinella TaxID=5974 RepID=A0A8J8P0U2_HALGN|nr:hypothetical protein FGO68_gene12437 [Halteria grandinella]
MQSKALYEEIFPKLPRSGSVLKRELKKSRKKKWWRGQRLKSKFKEFDIYGEQIGLTYKGESSFKTTPGAIVSCIVQLLMIAFTIYRLIIFVNKDDPSVSKQSFLRNLDGEDPLHPNEYGFNLAFGLGVPMDRSIGYYTANLVTFNYEFKEDGTRERKKYKKSMPLDYCGNSSFQGLNASQVSMYGIPGFQCINQSSLYLCGIQSLQVSEQFQICYRMSRSRCH